MEQLNLEQFKAEVHRTLIPKLDLEKLSRVESNQARQAVARMIGEIIGSQRVPWSSSGRPTRRNVSRHPVATASQKTCRLPFGEELAR